MKIINFHIFRIFSLGGGIQCIQPLRVATLVRGRFFPHTMNLQHITIQIWKITLNPFPHTTNLQQTTSSRKKYGKSLENEITIME